MIRLHQVVGVFLVAALGLWGCSRGPAGAPDVEHVKALEDKNARLEEDYKSASSARDQLRKRLSATEQVQAQLQQEVDKLRAAAKERDELVKARTQERDQLQVQYDGFRKNLRELLGQAEASLTRPNDIAGGAGGPALSPASGALPAVAGGASGPALSGSGY